MEPPLQLYDPRNGDLALKVETFASADALAQPQRSNYFTVYWVQEGGGTFWADLGQHAFGSNTLLFLVPYQCFRILTDRPTRGIVVQFHANFLCIETHHEEVGCNGVLFNDLYGVPVVPLDEAHARDFADLLSEIGGEIRTGGLAHAEVLVAYLKIFLVRATRLKLQQQEVAAAPSARHPPVLSDLKKLIEIHFRARHAPADYAELLHLAPKSLARIVKAHFNKTLTDLIRERILKQAKWELLHTLKPVKRVAAELGFDDVFYFSRLFKRATGCSPSFFRAYETAIRSGRNLSMQ
jgi:AraC family transcriptional activator of pobA